MTILQKMAGIIWPQIQKWFNTCVSYLFTKRNLRNPIFRPIKMNNEVDTVLSSKLGLILLGPLGTGKTETVSAICRRLERNIDLKNEEGVQYFHELDYLLGGDLLTENEDTHLKKLIS